MVAYILLISLWFIGAVNTALGIILLYANLVGDPMLNASVTTWLQSLAYGSLWLLVTITIAHLGGKYLWDKALKGF